MKHLMTIDRPLRIVPSGIYTVRGPHGHRSFAVERQDEKDEWAPGEWVLYVLTGGSPDDPRAWTCVGFVKHPKGGLDTAPGWRWEKNVECSAIVPFKKQREGPHGKLCTMLWEMIVQGRRRFRSAVDGQEHDYEILVSKHCLRCGARLTTPKSIEAGYGPECRAKLGIVA